MDGVLPSTLNGSSSILDAPVIDELELILVAVLVALWVRRHHKCIITGVDPLALSYLPGRRLHR